MKLRKLLSVTLVLSMLVMSLTGCGGSKDDKLSVGTWDGNTFTNEWIGIQMEFPEDIHIATAAEIKEVNESGAEILVNDGTFTEAEAKAAELVTTYDFMVTLSDEISSIALIHSNVGLENKGKGMSEKDYLEELKNELEPLGFVAGSTETVKLGGVTFTKLPCSVMGMLYQDYYCLSKGKYMTTFIVTYMDESAADIDSIMSGIKSAK